MAHTHDTPTAPVLDGNAAAGLLGELSLEVSSGLKGGETLITGPFKSLRELKPGDPVKVEKPKKDEDKKS